MWGMFSAWLHMYRPTHLLVCGAFVPVPKVDAWLTGHTATKKGRFSWGTILVLEITLYTF